MCVNVSERRGRLCVLNQLKEIILAHSPTAVSGGEGLPPKIRNLSNCDVLLLFKRQLDNYLSLLHDVPCTPNTDNSITGAVHGRGSVLVFTA